MLGPCELCKSPGCLCSKVVQSKKDLRILNPLRVLVDYLVFYSDKLVLMLVRVAGPESSLDISSSYCSIVLREFIFQFFKPTSFLESLSFWIMGLLAFLAV